MGDNRIAELADVLIACHGAKAEEVPRSRQARCRRRQQPEWEER
jgi:hypothetical protein